MEKWYWETDESGEEFLIVEETIDDGEEVEFLEWSPADDEPEESYLEPEKELEFN